MLLVQEQQQWPLSLFCFTRRIAENRGSNPFFLAFGAIFGPYFKRPVQYGFGPLPALPVSFPSFGRSSRQLSLSYGRRASHGIYIP